MQSQLAEVFKSLVYADYPDAWPGLLEAVYGHLSSGDELRVYGGLVALRLLARKYEFRDEEERGPLGQLVAATFPALVAILRGVLSNPSAGASAGLTPAHYAKLALKVFWSATFMGIPDALLADEQFGGWMGAIHELLRRQLPADQAPADKEDRAKWVWVKAQKWALHVAYRLFTRYTHAPRCNPGNDRAFAERFSAEVAPQFLEDVLALLQPVAAGGWLAPRCANLALQFVTAAVDEKGPYRALKPHLDGMLLHVVLPLLAFDDDDAELWADDPAEFVRKGYDILEDMYSPRTAAQNLLLVVAQKKRKAHLAPFMAHVAAALSAHNDAAREAAAAGRPVAADVARRMDAALLAIGTCADVLKNKSPYREQVETMLLTFVAPCFESPHGHLRAKACWVAKEFSDFTFSGGEGECGRGPQFCGLFERVMRGLADPDLPVRVDAVVALRSFVDDLADLEILKPILPSLLDSVFALMAEVDNEDLIFTLEGIVEKFGDEIAPYAANLAQNLAAAFWKYTQATEDDDGDEDTDTGALGEGLWFFCTCVPVCGDFVVLRVFCRDEGRKVLCRGGGKVSRSFINANPTCNNETTNSRDGRLWLHPHPQRAAGLGLDADAPAAGPRGGALPDHVRDDLLSRPGRVRGGHGHGLVLHLLHAAHQPAAVDAVAADPGVPRGVGDRLLGQHPPAPRQPHLARHGDFPGIHGPELPGVAVPGTCGGR